MSFDRHLNPLEPRVLFAANDPYPVRDGSLLGSFTSRTPFVVSLGDSIDLKFRVRNISDTFREGTVDLTFVLVPTDAALQAVRGDPVLASLENTQVSLKPKASTVFKVKGTLPEALDFGDYRVAVAVNPGGSIDAGADYGPTIGGAATFLGYSDVDVLTYNVRPSKADGANAAVVSGSLRNLGLSPAKGNVTLNFYAAQSTNPSTSDVYLSQSIIDLDLKARARKTFKAEVLSPSSSATLPAGTYYLRVEILRQGLIVDLDRDASSNAFSKKPIPLGR